MDPTLHHVADVRRPADADLDGFVDRYFNRKVSASLTPIFLRTGLSPNAITVLDLPVAGRDRDEVWARVEALRGRSSAAAFARTHHAGTYAEQRERYASAAELQQYAGIAPVTERSGKKERGERA